MKQYRFTSQDFVPQGESGDPDAVMDASDLASLRKLAGLPITEDLGDNGAGAVAGLDIKTPQAQEVGIASPVGSVTKPIAIERANLQREYHAMPGSDLWFIINFGKPELTKKSLRQQVEDYLNTHPEYRPKPAPNQI
ncbi:MAG TPA: hypothetical protein VFM18_19325 [Methanosarcina sp.]|nr:hypothetical protein [Methanosarcina sp.]